MVRETSDRGATVLLSSHVMSEVEHLTSRVALLRAGRLTAYENYCPHDGGPVCQGKVIPRVEEELASDQTSRGLRFSDRRNIVCPWHGWEFDIETGRHCGDPKYRLRPVNVRVEDNRVYVTLPNA